MTLLPNLIVAVSTSLIIFGSNDTTIYCKTFSNFNKVKRTFDQQNRSYYFTIGTLVNGEVAGAPSKTKTTYVARQNDTTGLIYTVTTKTAKAGNNVLFK
jgi:hypothetical protein